ncbi:alpha-D-ribose 1-methylphosphonate 5-triphosphate synthase subunit PhnH [Rhizobiales bacterium GAS188]|nr:alpha-D-ribose 1-methylphosphonate 5-triphosphate synthase subunit PhnH [Rhizobiales bacterium GAS188]
MTIATELPRFSGFAERVFDAQTSFRAIMDGLANPGRIELISVAPDAPAGLAPALACAALALIDHDTPVFLDRVFAKDREIAAYLGFHTGCRFVEDPSLAAFALIGDPAHCPDLKSFAQGTLEYPDRSTTLILQVASLEEKGGLCLSGPGIKDNRSLGVAPLPAGFADQLRANRERFPQGVDLLFCERDRLVGLSRSTRIEG